MKRNLSNSLEVKRSCWSNIMLRSCIFEVLRLWGSGSLNIVMMLNSWDLLIYPRPPLYPDVLRGHDLLSSCVHVSSLVFQYWRHFWCGILLHHPGRWDFKKCTFIKSKHFASKVLKLDICFMRKTCDLGEENSGWFVLFDIQFWSLRKAL